jgi:predicted MFS family arabinose efflux permease
MVETPRARSRAGHDLAPLYIVTFLAAAANGVVFPLLADLQDAHDLPTYGLGVISAASFLTALFAQLALAGQADRGRAKTMLLAGLALSFVSLVTFAISTELWQFTLARAMSGLAIGCMWPATRSIIARLDAEHVGRNLGRLASMELGGFITAPVLGAAVAKAFGLDAPFWLLAAVMLVALVALARRPVPGAIPGYDPAAPRSVSLDLLRYREVVVASILALALFMPVGIYDSLWSRYLQDRGASTLFIGVTLALYGVPFILLASRGGRLADRVGPFRAAFVCLVLIAPVIAVYGLFTVPIVIVSFAIIEAVIQAVAVPASQAAMAQACPPERLAAGQGLAGAAGQLGAGLMALGAAPVYEATGSEALFIGAAALTLGLGAIAWVLHSRRTPAAAPPAHKPVRGSIA